LLDKLRLLELDKVILVTNERYYPKFVEWLSNYIPPHPLLLLSDGTKTEEERLGAIGDLKFVLDKEGIKDDILVFTSDLIFSFSLNNFLLAVEGKRDQNWIFLYRLRRAKDASRYGVAKVDELGRVVEFKEKPKEPFSPLVAFGIYYFPKAKLHLIEEFMKGGNVVDAPGHYIQWLIEKDELYAYIQGGGVWIDIGDKKQYQEAEKLVRKSRRMRKWLKRKSTT
jgi:glucose-1-phosphate thymidylyltransferase